MQQSTYHEGPNKHAQHSWSAFQLIPGTSTNFKTFQSWDMRCLSHAAESKVDDESRTCEVWLCMDIDIEEVLPLKGVRAGLREARRAHELHALRITPASVQTFVPQTCTKHLCILSICRKLRHLENSQFANWFSWHLWRSMDACSTQHADLVLLLATTTCLRPCFPGLEQTPCPLMPFQLCSHIGLCPILAHTMAQVKEQGVTLSNLSKLPSKVTWAVVVKT